MEHKLDDLRQEVAAIDQEILRLVARRLEVTDKIGAVKVEQRKPIRNFRVEVDVLNRARDAAKELGFDPSVATAVAKVLMETSVASQSELSVPKQALGVGATRIHVVGGAGLMGQWISRLFHGLGHQVTVSDPGSSITEFPQVSPEEGCDQADIVVLATPLAKTPEIFAEVLKLCQNNQIIVDIASLKSHLVGPLRQAVADGYRVTSIHPMFGPSAVLLAGRAVLLCDCGDSKATESVRNLLEETALSLVTVRLEEHDKIMAAVLGMSHAVNLVFFRALSKLGVPYARLGVLASTTFAKQIQTSGEVVHESPELYHAIQYYNEDTEDMFQALSEALAELTQASSVPEDSAFRKFVQDIRNYIGGTV